MLCSALDVGKQRHVVDIHLVQRHQASVAIVARNLYLGEYGTVNLLRKVRPNVALKIRIARESDEQGPLTDQAEVRIAVGRDNANRLCRLLDRIVDSARGQGEDAPKLWFAYVAVNEDLFRLEREEESRKGRTREVEQRSRQAVMLA